MSRILYNIDDRDFAHKDVLGLIAGYVNEDPAPEADNIEDCLYYTFYHEAEGGYIVISLKLEDGDEVNFLVQICGEMLRQSFGGDKHRDITTKYHGFYTFKFPDHYNLPIDFFLKITRTKFDSVVKTFKESRGQSIKKSAANYLANKCRTFAYKKNYSDFYNTFFDNVRYESYILIKNTADVSLNISCVFHSCKLCGMYMVEELAEIIRIFAEHRDIRLPPLEENGDFVVEISFTNEFQHCGKEICLKSRISMKHNIYHIASRMTSPA